MNLYHEIAIGSPRQRGLLIPEEQVIDVILEHGQSRAVYKSVYLYDDEALEYFKLKRTLKDFLGKRYIKDILIDIDKGQNTDEHTLNKTRGILFELEEFNIQQGSYISVALGII